MKILSTLWWLFLTSVGVIAIVISIKMYQKYRLKYLLYYAIFLIFSYAYAFLDVVADYLTQGILICRLSPYQTVNTVSLVFSLLAFPFIILAWFFFIFMVLEWLGKNFALIYQIAYFVLQGLFVVAYAYTINHVSLTPFQYSSGSSSWIIFIFHILNHGILFLVIFLLVFQSESIKEPVIQKTAKYFGLLYLLGFILHFTFLSLISLNELFCYGYPIVEFFMHFPPLLYLFVSLKRYAKILPFHPQNEAGLAKFFSKHKISRREQEIILLILKGKSNHDVEDELFISIKTVKSHIYNIYRKLGVKNRWQLINLVQNINSSQ